MRQVNVFSFGKINLSLDVLGIMDNGYHQVEMVMQQVAFHDDVLVRTTPYCERTEKDKNNDGIYIELSTNKYYLPTDERNLAFKAAKIMAEKFGNREELKGSKVRIDIKKRIPVAAGLAGGSGNGAAVLLGLNKLWNLKLTVSQLCEIGKSLGSDVPFCIMGQAKANLCLGKEMNDDVMAAHCAIAKGTGTDLTPIEGLTAEILLIKPSISVSTAKVYGEIDKAISQNGCWDRPNNEKLIDDLKNKNYSGVKDNMINVLELVTVSNYPMVKKLKDKMEKDGSAIKVMMSGSGPTVFAVYTNRRKALMAYERIKGENRETYLTRTTV